VRQQAASGEIPLSLGGGVNDDGGGQEDEEV